MRRAVALAGLALAAVGCVARATPSTPDRADLIRGILASTVQLKSEQEAGARRAGSGVVVAVDRRAGRTWIVTTRHFIQPSLPQPVYIRQPGRTSMLPATVAFVSHESDLAIIETEYLDVPPARLKNVATLGDEILLVAYPWGQRFTVVRGVVSQIEARHGELPVTGTARMVSATVSYGSSGGGVFDAETGELVGIVESFRTAKVAIPEMKDRVLEVPVAGETTIISARVIAGFLADSGLKAFLAR
ncbi:MAG: S1 family peptidase [Candidatus Rokuibacteriota bacterium]